MSAALSPLPKKEPSEQLEPSQLWQELTKLPRPSRNMPIARNRPGTDEPIGEVLVWPLTQEEQMSANAEADRWTKRLLKDPQKKEEANLGYHHTFTNEVAVQVLVRACRDVNDPNRPAFPSADLVRRTFTTDEIGVMFNSFCTIQSELGPIRAHMTPEQVEGFILRLIEGGSAFPFDSISWEQQRSLVLSMAYRLFNCWTAMCSAGLPLDVSSSVLSESLKKHAGAPVTQEADEPEQSESEDSTSSES